MRECCVKKNLALSFSICFLLSFFAFHTLCLASSRESLSYPVPKLVEKHPLKVTIKKLFEKNFTERILNQPICYRSSLFVSFTSGTVASYNLSDGEQRWTKDFPAVEGILDAIEDVILVKCKDKLLALQVMDGEKAWEIEYRPGTLYAKADESGVCPALMIDAVLYRLNVKNGLLEKLSKLKIRDGKATAFACDAKKRAIVVVDQQAVTAFNLKTGKKLWSFLGGSNIPAPPLIYQKRLLVMCQDNYFYCLNARNGNLIYRKKADNRLMGGGERISSIVLFSSFASKNLNLLHIATGEIKSLFSLSSERYHFIYQPSYNAGFLVAAYADFFSDSNSLVVFEVEVKEEKSF